MGFRSQVASSAVLIAPLYLVMAGTAGVCSPRAIAQVADFSPTAIIRIVGRNSDQQTLSISESLKNVRDTFGLKMSELAEIFGVSRTAAYDWLSGATPKPEIAIKIELLATYADSIAQHAGHRSTLLRRNPLLAGRKLVAAMKTSEGLESIVLTLSEGRITESPFLDKSIEYKRGKTAPSNSFEEIVTPAIIERT
jgi:transcriptional regulator with XRE-family HTH domain